ncbi:MAG: type II toxin-antitoxin system VapB family antitoxin [Acidobacteria bacterium]|nr:type II toxin-antitoxin system VapB family antitoxin [Acidobacteriota bacterium]
MRITLDLPADLLEEARQAVGLRSKTDTVVLALRELLRGRRIDELKSLLGKVRLDVDLPKSRRRQRRQSA